MRAAAHGVVFEVVLWPLLTIDSCLRSRVRTMVEQESGWQRCPLSSEGAAGLMQPHAGYGPTVERPQSVLPKRIRWGPI